MARAAVVIKLVSPIVSTRRDISRISVFTCRAPVAISERRGHSFLGKPRTGFDGAEQLRRYGLEHLTSLVTALAGARHALRSALPPINSCCDGPFSANEGLFTDLRFG